MATKDFTFGVHIDWMTVTGKYPLAVQRTPPSESSSAHVNAVSILRNLFVVEEFNFDQRGAGRFYEWYFADTQRGIRVDISRRPSQGWMVTLSGRFWSHGNGLSEKEWLARVTDNMKITRLDVAVDVFYTEVLPRDVFDDLRPTDDTTARRKLDFIMSQRGETLAIGSRESRMYMRVYDKAAEQGVDFTWLRAELEIKQDAAHNLAKIEVHEIFERSAAKMLEMIEGHESDLSDALNLVSNGVKPLESHRRDDTTDTERWFQESVIPALRNLAKRDQLAVLRVKQALLKVINSI